MLDAYIIDRIREEREKESRDGSLIPLHIEIPRPPRPERPAEDRDDKSERGSSVIDFQL